MALRIAINGFGRIGRLVLRADGTRAHALGSELRLRLDVARVSVFDAATEARL